MDQVLLETIRVAFLLLIPLMVVSSLTGLVVGLLQRSIRLDEVALVLSFKTVAIVATLFVIIPNLLESLQSLVILCLQSI